MPQGQIHSIVPILIAIAVFVPLMAWRLRRLSQTRPLRLELLWVTPAILIALAAMTFLAQPPQDATAWIYLGVALVIGGALGWWRGKLMRITVDPQTHALNTKGSPAAMIFIVAILAIRYAVRGIALSQASSLHLSVAVITGVFVVFAVGLFGIQRLEMFLRGSRLLAEARATKAAA